MPFLTVHMPQETPQYGPTGEVSRPNWTVAPGEVLAAPLGAKKAGHACLADLAGVTPYGGGANTSSVPSILVAVVTGAIAWKARAWLTLVQIAITLTASTATPSAPVATSGPRGPTMLLTWSPVQSGGRIGSRQRRETPSPIGVSR